MVQRGITGNGREGPECGMSEIGLGWKVCCCVQPGIACTHSRKDCAIVAAVWVVTLATNAGVELELGPLAHVQHRESSLGGIGASSSSGIVSASWNVSLASSPSPRQTH